MTVSSTARHPLQPTVEGGRSVGDLLEAVWLCHDLVVGLVDAV